jgi:hypothetical protein
MPDLIIKPTNTSGNKLILQDQAGGAVLTTADSGATIANATLTTPNLGTPSAVTLTNATFPAGHILKVQQFIVGTGTSSINSTNWVQYHTFDYSPHGGANNTSKIICIFHASVESQSDTAEGRSNMKVVVTGDDITNIDDEYAEAWGTYGTSSRTYGGHGFQLREIQLDGSGKADITFTFSAKNLGASSAQGFTVKGGAMAKSSATIFEFEA